MQTKQQSIMKEQKIINHTPEIEAYLKSIRKYKTMTRAEEKALFEEYQTATPARKAQIVDAIVKANQRFVFSMAKSYAKGDDKKIMDFVSEGNIGLVKSIDTFDYTKDFKFISYAVWGIKQHMTNFAETQNKFMKNANNKKIGNKVLKIKAAFFQEFHRDPTVDEIKEELEKQGVKIKKDSDLEDVVQNSIDSVWGDEARFENNPRYVQHSAVDNEYEKEIEAEENSNTVNKLLKGLDERSAEIIKMLFGIGYDSPMDVEAVAERMNLTTTRIGQIRNAALKKMKTYAETA